ncbi:MAG: hypothetical protein P4L16_00280 [Chlamydiales bacterium]|nr:hypothetical protein [Chlamydiales bacterium]
MVSEESKRLNELSKDRVCPWRKWGPYLSERAWASVREDYSADGNAWLYSTHDMARSKAFRWGDDGIAGFCDYYQKLIFSIAFWNGKDPILKERLFGLTPLEGNHGEDVKEYYYYLDATPTHSYMKYLYKYPQEEFPYDKLVQENKKRGLNDREYELVDTKIFDNNKYFDCFIEYAKQDPEDLCIRIEIVNAGKDAATIHVVPQLWFRNTWTWSQGTCQAPKISEISNHQDYITLFADASLVQTPKDLSFEYALPSFYLFADPSAKTLFTENETNNQRLWNAPNQRPYVKDGFHEHIIHNKPSINPEKIGSKAGLHYQGIEIPGGKSHVIRLRLTSKLIENPLKDIDTIIKTKKEDADAFYASIQPKNTSQDDLDIQRQAISGMIWSKQFYFYDVDEWLKGDFPQNPPPENRGMIRNGHWTHLNILSVLSMPDKWEYPWFAAWDLAFHTVTFSLVDLVLAKQQLELLFTYHMQHPNGQVPAYEWGFSDLNPPVHAWALWELFQKGKKNNDTENLLFLKNGFMALVRNFSWWINKVDSSGNNFFEGGFLGLDNISVVDRSRPLPNGGHFEQSDGTGWMGFFALKMMRISLELAKHYPGFEELAVHYLEHFMYISAAMESTKQRSIHLWNEEDGFFYDVISYPNDGHVQLKIRSFVGIVPFFAIDFFEEEELKQFPKFYESFTFFFKINPERMEKCTIKIEKEGKNFYLFSMMQISQMKRLLTYVWNPNEFRSEYGLRSLSKYHENHPIDFQGSRVGYEPGESLERIKGGNSNWRGPIWFPTNYLFLDALKTLASIANDSFQVTVPGEAPITLQEMAISLKNRLISLFRKDAKDVRPIHQGMHFYQDDARWKELLLFYEHYHADNGRGLGASHQTGWSGLVANLIDDH